MLSPHPDDETIGCGLLIAEKANRGIPVAVAVATDGRGGWFSPMTRPAPRDIAEVRHREWHRALDVLAVPQANRVELGIADGELTNYEDEVADRIGDLFRSVRPSQVFVTSSGDPHPDHRTLARAAAHAAAQTYGSGPGVRRPQFFTYRVYPGEGLWPEGRPSRITVSTAGAQFCRSVVGLARRRPLLFRAPGSEPKKAAAIDAYDSQSRLLGGELSYVWGTAVELYWPMDVDADH